MKQLRRQAIAGSLFPPTTLRKAIERLGFVQADPIRFPARAQDLILRHRVRNYRAGDLERHYPSLNIEEDVLYAYGFMPQSTWRLLHPRIQAKLTPDEAQVLRIVSAHKQLHPRELEAYLGRKREVNAWGGYSKSTTRVLERLHYRGLLRIARRENGIRLYEPASGKYEQIEPGERVRKLILLIAQILAPLPDRSLRIAIQQAARAAPFLKTGRAEIAKLIDSGELASATVDGIRYVWPVNRVTQRKPATMVHFLAPFDPVVWDRRRFEYLWGWSYRFEAYTPAAKRKLGYYAMPLLWEDDVIGWVNVSNPEHQLRIEPGFVNGEPKATEFRRELEAEIERFRRFLNIVKTS
ncbi:MAG: DNA glycosylase AlkZ-like family protein [Bryobacteraceae bacterium]